VRRAYEEAGRWWAVWKSWPVARQQALAAHCIDVCVRVALPQFFEAEHLVDDANVLRALAPIVDEHSMLRAEVALSRLVKRPLEPKALAPVWGLLEHFELLKGESQLEEAGLMLLLTSARLFGDLRLGKVLEQSN
jgi:hypothetical protein